MQTKLHFSLDFGSYLAPVPIHTCFPGSSVVKNLPAMQESWVQSLGQKDALKEEMATHSSIFCLGNPMDREAWQATVCGVAKSWT